MKKRGEWYVPDIMEGPDRYLRGWAELQPGVRRVHAYRSVVQAGGHIGIFPRELAKLFKQVYTFEPEHENFLCLVHNVSAANVFPMRALLGETHSPKELRVGLRNTGGHSVGGAGPVPMFRIDDLGLRDCDAIVLDLEGYEFFALLGAMETIAHSYPLIVVEENKKARGQGFQPGALALLLGAHGYKQREKQGENLIFEVPR